MLELYHSINSVCAQKVRIALKEKGQEVKDHIMTLRGGQSIPYRTSYYIEDWGFCMTHTKSH